MKFKSKEVLETKIRNNKIILIGAGQLGQMTLRLWPEQKLLPLAILDNYKIGEISNIPILNLENHIIQTDTTYISSMFKNNSIFINNLFHNIIKQPILTSYDIFDYYIKEKFSNGWNYTRKSTIKTIELDRIRDLFTEDKSIAIWNAVIAWRYERNLINEYPIEDEIQKYNITRFNNSKKYYDIIIDGGSYDFSFHKYIINSDLKFSQFIAFEPDNISHTRCTSYLSHLDESENIVLEKIALAKTNGERFFISNGDFSARLILYSDTTCLTTSIDKYLENKKLNNKKNSHILIKLHIEGAELESIEGALNTIHYNHVDLIINLSHTEDALIKIIPFLNKISKYDFYLRSSSLFGEGLTLFALSNK